MKPEQLRQLRRGQKLAREARGERLQAFLEAGGDPNEVRPELIPTEQDRRRLESRIRTGARQAELHPKGAARNRKVAALIPLVAELCVIERVLAMDPLARAALRPAQLVVLARTGPEEMRAKVYELVAGVIGGGDMPQIEVSGG